MNKQIDRKTLAKEIHQNAVAKGFWHTKPCEAGAQGTAGRIPQHYLMLVICELSEAVEAHRKDKRANRQAYEARTINGFESKVFELYIKDTLEDELADAYIRLLDFAEGFGYEVETEVGDIELNKFYEESKTKDFTEQIFHIVSVMGHVCRTRRLIYEFPYVLLVIETIASLYDIDLSWHITEKMKYNATRPTLHGKRY